MRAGAPAGGHPRPPITAAGSAGAPVRATARVRPEVPVRVVEGAGRFEPSDPYVRRFWVAAIGAGAVAELLRLMRAGSKGEEVRLPRHLPMLLRFGLVGVSQGVLTVTRRLPEVPAELRWRFPPSLAAEHSRWLGSDRPR